MSLRNKTIAAAVATNAVAAQTAVDCNEAINTHGVLYPGIPLSAVAAIQITPGSTPGNYTFVLEESDTSGGTYTAILAVDQTTPTGLSFHNVTVSKRYVRASVTDATANAGTLHANLLLA